MIKEAVKIQTLEIKKDLPEYSVIFVSSHLEVIASYYNPYHTALKFMVYVTATRSFSSLFGSQDIVDIFVKITFFFLPPPTFFIS